MLIYIGLGLALLVILFVLYVATRKGQFRYECSSLIQATPEKIFPYLSQFGLGEKWLPYRKLDPDLKKNIFGPDGEVGTVMVFEGNAQAGAGRLEFLQIVPDEFVQIRLSMTKPVPAENIVEYKLTSEAGGTRFLWSLQGDNGFIGKLVNVMIDCEAMVTGQFKTAIEDLKIQIESRNSGEN